MTLQEIKNMGAPIYKACELSDDAMLLFYFSKSDDGYCVMVGGMDFGDALIVVSHLIEKFKLCPAAIAAMYEGEKS